MSEGFPLTERLELFLTGRLIDRRNAQALDPNVLARDMAGVALPPGRVAMLGTLGLRRAVVLIGLPFGAVPLELKQLELRAAGLAGANAVGLVLDPGLLADERGKALAEEVKSLKLQMENQPASLGLVTEFQHTDWRERQLLCEIAECYQVDFLATSAGVVHSEPMGRLDVRRVRRILPKHTELWVVGDVADRPAVEELLSSGADRVGATPDSRHLLRVLG